MPFLAPAIPAIVGAAGSIGGSLLNRPNKQQQQGANTLSQTQQAGLDFGNTLKPMATTALGTVPGLLNNAGTALSTVPGTLATVPGLLGQATGTYNSALNFLNPIVSGNRTAMMSVLSPQVRQITSGYDAATANQRELTPRSGASATAAGDMPFRKAASLSDLFANTRVAAAGQLPVIAAGQTGVGAATTNLANAGTALGGALTNLAGAGTNLGATLGTLTNQGYGLGLTAADQALLRQIQERQQQAEQGSAFGSALYDIMKAIPTFNKGTP